MVRIKINDMDLEQIARSGQCFRMEKQDATGVWSIHTAVQTIVQFSLL